MTVTPTPRPTREGKAALDDLLHSSVEGRTVPALHFGVTTADGPVYFARAGERVFGEPDKGPVDDDTRLQLFSTTKLVTTIAVLQLVDRGLVDLDDAGVVAEHAPELCEMEILEGFDGNDKPVFRRRTRPLTLKRLLSHSSGLAYMFSSELIMRWEQATGHGGLWGGSVESFCEPLVFEPGTRWTYGIGIDWAGIIVERVSGQSLQDYFSEHIFAPLGITTLTFYPTPEVVGRLQQVCGRDARGNLEHSQGIRSLALDSVTGSQLSGGGGLFGTARDYLRFLQGVLASQNPGGIISPTAFTTLFTNALPPRGPDNTCYADLAKMTTNQTYHDPAHTANDAQYLEHSVGLVLNTRDSVHGRKAGSGCWDGAAKTQYWIDPATGIAGICFTQILAPNPDPFMRLFNKFERTVYDALG